jgi:hypothetical protein
VHTCVGASRGNRHCLFVEELCQCGFEVALNGADITLPGETVEGGPVVGKVEAEVQLS